MTLPILHQQEIEVFVEFPVSVLASYNGESNLDETWDDNIMAIINSSLSDTDLSIEESEISILPATIAHEEKLSYRMSIIAKPPIVDLSCIVSNLKKENFDKGLCIKVKATDNSLNTLYSDSLCADRT